MGRMYTVKFSGVAVTAAQDLFEVQSPTDAVTKVHEYKLYQTTDVGDAAEEILRLETVRGVGAVTSGSGGTTVTPQPVSDGDAAFGGVAEANNTTRMVVGTGTLESQQEDGWNVRQPHCHTYTPENRPEISPGNRWTLSLPAAPADSLTMGGEVTLEEIGG